MDSVQVRKTGKQIDRLVIGLLESADDKNKDVQQSISDSMLEIGKHYPDLVLSSCLDYLITHLKQLSQTHRICILKILSRVIEEVSEELDESLAADLVKQAAAEMIASKDVIHDWQSTASRVLLALGVKFIDKVMAELTLHFQPGVLPHFYVVQTLGKLASVNAFGMVPYIQVVIATMLPMLGMAKTENLRWVFAQCLSNFAESIIYYTENIDQAPDKGVRKEAFSNEFYSAFELLFNVWLGHTKEGKVRAAVALAVGQTSHILSSSQLSDQVAKLLPGLINLYKKQSDPLPITQSVCMILDSVTTGDSRFLDQQLDVLVNQLHGFICQPVDYLNNQQVRNQNELLRCISMINRVYSDRVVAGLLHRLEQNNEKIRTGTLLIIKHLVNSGGPSMDTKKALVISGLRILLNESNNKVKKMLAQTIISMAHHEYLELEGGELMVEFIVKQCCLPNEAPSKRQADPEYVTSQALRSMCESVLQLVTSTIECMERVLWPYLLEFILPVQYTEAMSVVCKNLALLAGKKRQTNSVDYILDYQEEANLPAPEALMARLFVMAGVPCNDKHRAENVLKAMQALVPNVNEELVPIWDDVIPKLLEKLEELEDEDEWNQKKWDDLVLRLLSSSINALSDDALVLSIGEKFGQQVVFYKSFPSEMNFAYKCLGVVLRKTQKKEFIAQHMDIMFQHVDHGNAEEQEGLAVGLGFTAAAHVDAVLTKLESVLKGDGRKSGGIISFFKDKSESENPRLKQTVVLSYGYVTLYAPISLTTSRVEAVIFRNLQPHLSNMKDPVMKKNMIQCIELIGKTMHPLHLQKSYTFTQRKEFVNYLMACLKVEPKDRLAGPTLKSVFSSLSALIKLDPILEESELHELMDGCLLSVIPLPSDGVTKGKTDSYEEQVAQAELMKSTLTSFKEMLQELLLKDFTSQGFMAIFKHMPRWMTSTNDNEREKVTQVLQGLLEFYLDHISQARISGDFEVLGELLGRLVPRCTDPNISVREYSITAIQAALKIQLVYQGEQADGDDALLAKLPVLKERLQKSDSSILFGAVNDLSKVIARKSPGGKLLTDLLETLMDGLADAEELCSNGACVVLNGVTKLRGAELGSQVESYMTLLQEKIQFVSVEQTKAGALRCIRSLGSHHLEEVTNCLLQFPLPFNATVGEFWQVLGKDSVLLGSILDSFLRKLCELMPYEEKPNPADKRTIIKVATGHPIAIVMAMGHLLSVPEAKEVTQERYSCLLSAVLLKVGAYAGARGPLDTGYKSDRKSKSIKKQEITVAANVDPASINLTLLKNLFVVTESTKIYEELDEADVWSIVVDPERYVTGIELIAKALCQHEPSRVSSLIETIRQSLTNLYDTDRVVATSLFGQLLAERCGNHMELVESLVGSLMGRLVDSCLIVRMLCIRGLGNIANTGAEMVQKYSTTVLSAMMSGMDDKDDMDDFVTLEAMNGLSKILESVDESHIRPILINISLKIRPCFEKNQASVRAAAFQLFGNLSRFGSGPSAEPFYEQLLSNFTSLLLHLAERDAAVVVACKRALRSLAPLIRSDGLRDMCDKYLLEEGHLHFGEFINSLSKLMVIDYKEKVPFFVMNNVSFFKSQWPEIRANAAIYLGFLLNALPHGDHGNISQDHVSNALMTLIKDSDSTVRCKAAEAMSLLSHF